MSANERMPIRGLSVETIHCPKCDLGEWNALTLAARLKLDSLGNLRLYLTARCPVPTCRAKWRGNVGLVEWVREDDE